MQNASTRPRRALAAAAVGAATLAASVSLTTPAQAASVGYFNGCTVTSADKPVFSGHNDVGVKRFNYQVSVTCYGDRSIRFEQRVYEQDPGTDQRRASRTTGWQHYTGSSAATSKKTWNYRVNLANTDGDGSEEIYHQVRIQVRSNGNHPVTSEWSPWAVSQVVSAPVG